MTIRNVKAFFGKVEDDKGLQTKLKALDKKVKKAMDEAMDAALNKIVAIAKAEGFEFTPQDLVKARSQKPRTPGKLKPQAEFTLGPGIGCQPGMGLYISVDPPSPPHDPDGGPCYSTYKLHGK